MSYNFDEMELDELESLLHNLQEQKESLRTQMITVKQVISEKRAAQAAQAAYDRMSDPERAALHQIVGVQPARAAGVAKDGK